MKAYAACLVLLEPALAEIIVEKKRSEKPAPCPGDPKDPIEAALETGRVRRRRHTSTTRRSRSSARRA